MDRRAAEEWIRSHVTPTGPIEVAHQRPWATVLRVPVTGGAVWLKACGEVQAFEPRLTAALSRRWPDRVTELLSYSEENRWMLMADGGAPVGEQGNPPERWLAALPAYAELQRGEALNADDHLAHGVPDLRVSTLPTRLDELLVRELPLDSIEMARLRAFASMFQQLCEELCAYGISDSIQHDDLHHNNLYERAGRLRVLDWGDSSISHPFASLVVTFRFLEEVTGLNPDDTWFIQLRDAYLEPWGKDMREAFALALRIGAVAHACAWARQRTYLPAHERAGFDTVFRIVLRRALANLG